MDDYKIRVCFPSKWDKNGDNYEWSSVDFETSLEAESIHIAYAKIQKKIEDGKFDAELFIPSSITGQVDISVTIRPYINNEGAATLEGFLNHDENP